MCRDLDLSDIRSLDMTSRRALGEAASALATVGSAATCSIPRPFGGQLSAVQEEDESKKMDVSSFSPLSDKCHISTMRETSMKERLSSALEAIDMLPSPGMELLLFFFKSILSILIRVIF